MSKPTAQRLDADSGARRSFVRAGDVGRRARVPRITSLHTVSQGIPLERGDIHGQPSQTQRAVRIRLPRGSPSACRRPTLEVLEGRALLSTFTVNSFGDAGLGSGGAGDLRYCINQANADNQANTIVFDSTLFSTPQTMDLSDGSLELSDTGGTQTITGPTAELTISGAAGNIFQVDPGVTASISGLTITGSFETNLGGGLANDGTATLTDCTFSSNSAGIGGGVFNSGTGNLTLTDCTVSGLISSGVFNLGIANLTDCTLSGNYGYKEGGGVYNNGTATLTNCSLSGNYALVGGGVFNSDAGNVTLTGCDISYNSCVSGDAGGVFNSGTATLIDCTISGNEAGGIAGGVSNSGNLTLTDCNVSGNTRLHMRRRFQFRHGQPD